MASKTARVALFALALLGAPSPSLAELPFVPPPQAAARTRPFGWQRELKARYAEEMDCHDDLRVEDLGAGLVRVTGCAKYTRYLCNLDAVCAVESSSGDSLRRHREAARRQRIDAGLEKRRQSELAALRPRVVRMRHEKGYEVLTAILPGRNLELNARAAPSMDRGQVLWTVHVKEPQAETPAEEAACVHAIAADGVPLALPGAKAVREDGALEYRFKLPLDVFATMASATRVAGRTCEARWQLDTASLTALSELLQRFREALALDEPAAPRSGASVMEQSAPP
jgi:hypothetical protein